MLSLWYCIYTIDQSIDSHDYGSGMNCGIIELLWFHHKRTMNCIALLKFKCFSASRHASGGLVRPISHEAINLDFLLAVLPRPLQPCAKRDHQHPWPVVW